MTSRNLGLASWLVGSVALFAAATLEKAAAIEVQCIEESKYKHLYQLFGGDTRKFAAYLQIDLDKYRLPDPETCRAALVSGGIEHQPRDREKLLDFIVRNQGWLATVHLYSGGGSVWTGQQLGYIVRAFRLKTVTARNVGNKLLYEPDFLLAPLPASLSPASSVPAGVTDAPQSKPARCMLDERVPTALNAKGFFSGISRPDTSKATAPEITYEENTDRPGSDYREFDLASDDPKLCQKACVDEARCRAWVYRTPKGRTNGQPHCHLKERASAVKTDKLNVAGTVVRFQYTEPTFEENTNRPGSDYRDLDLAKADPKLCQKACIDEARCRAWSYQKPESRSNGQAHCWLKEHVPSVSRTDKNIVSGMVIRADRFEPIYEEDVDRPGPSYRTFDQLDLTPRKCQKACADDPKCRAWTYERPSSAYLVSLAAGWEAYREQQRTILSAPAAGGNWCASSCVQLHVAGLDRSGIMQVHRPNAGFTNMNQQAQNLNRDDATMPQFYQYMDAGDRITGLMRATSATTVTPTFGSRFPRYVLDYLIVHCDVDAEQLQNLEEQLQTTIKELDSAGEDVSLRTNRLKMTLVKLHDRRRRAEQCVAQAQEQDRLAAYNKLCSSGSCDQKKLGIDFDEATKKIQSQSR